jgi:putative SOS response-associated peptidase YedK
VCGRTNLTATPEELAEAFALDPAEVPELVPRYNIAPTQPMAVVRMDARRQRRLSLLRWGLVPSGAGDPRVGARLINARSESASTRGVFRGPFRERRCLVPATGFYEWRRIENSRQPYLLRRRDGGILALAGLWDRWRAPQSSPEGHEPIESCTILTTAANELVARLHDRMPVVLDPADYERWLDPALQDAVALFPLLRPYPAEEMVAIPVSPRVNSPDADDPGLLEPIDPEAVPVPRQRSLF